MIQVKATVKGQFSERLAQRVSKWQGLRRLAARIRVDPELKWWVYQEYGTAPHIILPVNAEKLAFTDDGKQIITDVVHHPGTKPKRMIEGITGDIHQATALTVSQAFREGGADNPELVHQAVLQSTEHAKELIVQRFHEVFKDTPRQNLSGREQQAGKLAGTTAADAFDAGAVVVDLTE